MPFQTGPASAANQCITLSGFNELYTTALGRAAYSGHAEAVNEAIARGIDWSVENTHPLHAALYGNQGFIARALVAAGSPYNEATYELAVDRCPEAVPLLSPRPDLVQKFELAKRTASFNGFLISGDLDSARGLLKAGVDLNKPVLLAHGMGAMCAIHYAARLGSVEALRLVLDAGAEINLLTRDGKSGMRLVAEHPSHSRAARANALQFLRKHGGRFLPAPASPWVRLRSRLGFWLDPSR